MNRRELLKSAGAVGAGFLMSDGLRPRGSLAIELTQEAETFELGDFTLLSGEVLRSARLDYSTMGRLNQNGDNVIVYPTWYGGRHTSNEGAVERIPALDPSRYFIVMPDQFGNGLSSSPSNTAPPQDRMRFPLVTPYDNVRAQHRLLTERYGIDEIALVVGYSMSGQQAFHWGALYPEMVQRIAPICGSAKTSVHNWIFLEGLKAALTADSNWAEGEYESPPLAGLRAFSRVYTGWWASQAFFREGLHSQMQGGVEEPFVAAEQLFGSFDANDLLAMLATWQAADISAHPRFGGDMGAALGAIRSRAFVMPSRTDLYFRTADNELEVAQMPNAELREIPSAWGHLAGAALDSADALWLSDQIAALLSE